MISAVGGIAYEAWYDLIRKATASSSSLFEKGKSEERGREEGREGRGSCYEAMSLGYSCVGDLFLREMGEISIGIGDG